MNIKTGGFTQAIASMSILAVFGLVAIFFYFQLSAKTAHASAIELYDSPLYNDANLISYWRLEGSSTDSKGSNNGTDSNVSYATSTGKFGQGASFNKNSPSKISTGMSGFPTGSAARTISVWIYPSSLSTANFSTAYTYGSQTSHGINDVGLFWDTDHWVAFYDTWGETAYANASVSLNNWYLLTGTFDGITLRLYLDGALIASQSASSVNTPGSSNGYAGIQNNGSSNPWNGNLDDIAVFSRALSDQEISDLYGGDWEPAELYTTPLYYDPALISYYRMEGDSSDSSGSNDGTDSYVSYDNDYGKFGQGASFDEDLVSNINTGMSGFPTGSDARTISAWVNPRDLSTAFFSTAFTYGSSSPNEINDLGLYWDTDHWVAFYDTWGETAYADTDISLDEWYLLTGTLDNSVLSLYLNGSLIATSSATSVDTPSGAGYVGVQNDGASNPWNGYLDDVAVFSRALTPREISNLYSGNWESVELYETPLFSDPNLISYWRLEGNANDSKGSNNGTSTNISYSTGAGRFNQGASFNKNSPSKINTGMSGFPTGSNARTISTWIYPTSLSTVNFSTAYTYGSQAAHQINDLGLYWDSGQWYAFYDTWGEGIATSTNISLNNWYMLTATFNGSTLKLYLDGNLIASGSASSVNTPSLSSGYIGIQNNGSGNPWNGYMDDVAVFSRVLTDSEVRALYLGY